MRKDMFCEEWENLIPHIEDDLRMDNFSVDQIEHTTENCQCEGKLCKKCEKVRCQKLFTPNKRRGNRLLGPCFLCCRARYQETKHLPKMKRQKRPVEDRFLEKIEMGPNGCWLWTGRLEQNGYGVLTVNAQTGPIRAHRLSHEFFKGPIPQGLVIDHLCCVRSCVNPDHLEAVTDSENSIRCNFRLGNFPLWAKLYRDLYREIYGEQVSENEWRRDAEQRKERLKGRES